MTQTGTGGPGNDTNGAVRAARGKIPAAEPDKPSFLLPPLSPNAARPLILFFTHMGVTNASPKGIFIGNTWYRNLFKIFINSTCVQPRIQKRGEGRGVTDQTPDKQKEEGRGGRY